MKNFTLSFFFVFLFGQLLKAQDPQFSQYYASPLYTNPAYAGSEDMPRLILNFRHQWPNLEADFRTYSASFDHYFEEINSGVGIIFNRDVASAAGYQSQDIGLQYAYQTTLNSAWSLRTGMQASYVIRDYNFSRLIFGDQYIDDNGNLNTTSLEGLPNESRAYINMSLGGLVYSEKYWLGFSAHNVNRPRQDILDNNSTSRLPVRYTLQLGAKFPLNRYENWRDRYKSGYRERSISPTLLYKKQGPFDQLDLGVYITYQPIVLGFWYRGIPIKEYEIGIGNNESLIGLIGLQMGNLSLGYSYDYTISSLSVASGGAHELSLRILFVTNQKNGGKKQKFGRNFPCPKF